mgnify:CR=1 FL=1
MEKINLLFFSSDYKIGLAFTITGQAESIFKLSNVNLICVSGEKEQEKGLSLKYDKLEIPLIRINGLDEHRNFYHLANELCSIINEKEIQIVHIHNNWQLALVSYIKFIKRKNIKIIYSIHGYRHNNKFKAFFARRIIGLALLLFADLVLAGSTSLKKAIPFIKRKCHLMFQGVEDELFKNRPNFNFNDTLNIVFVGQFRKGKNQELLIKTLYKYSVLTGDFNYILHLAGKGELKNDCEMLVKKLNFSNNVIFHGQLTRTNLFELYEKCQISIIPTNSETFGYCIAEPYVAGLCVISRRTGIANDIIEDGKNGLLFDDFNELTDLLTTYLPDQKKLKLMAEKSFSGHEVLRWKNITNQYNKILSII